MKPPIPIETGRVVISRAGRDRGTAYAVLEVLPGDRALVADGRARTLDHPKKKNVKHLRPKPDVIPDLAEKIRLHKRNFDEELRAALADAETSDT